MVRRLRFTSQGSFVIGAGLIARNGTAVLRRLHSALGKHKEGLENASEKISSIHTADYAEVKVRIAASLRSSQ